MQSPGLEAGPADPGVHHLPQLVRTRLDSWYPRRLPARFRPSQRPRAPRLLRPVPLALAALLLAVLAATALAGSPKALTDVIVTLGGSRPAATPTPRQRIAAPEAATRLQPAPAAIVTTPNLVTPGPASSPALPAFGQAASAPRMSTSVPMPPRPTSTASLAASSPRSIPNDSPSSSVTLPELSPSPRPTGLPQPSS
jgi:hypothetical protein